MAEKSDQQEKQIVGVRFHYGGKIYHFDPSACEDLVPGDFVVVETVRGRQLGQAVYLQSASAEEGGDLKPVLRRATGQDLALRQSWEQKAQKALETAKRAAIEMNLTLKPVTAEYTLDGGQLTFLFVNGTKDEIQALQRRLSRSLRMRVEMRQVGPRDHARLTDGYGACGEPRCCCRFLVEFAPISIRMGKSQGISLTPAEITGMCGRLRCCLSYEHEMYVKASKDLPRRKARVNTPHGTGKVVDLLPLEEIVVVQIEDRRVEVPADEVEVIPK